MYCICVVLKWDIVCGKMQNLKEIPTIKAKLNWKKNAKKIWQSWPVFNPAWHLKSCRAFQSIIQRPKMSVGSMQEPLRLNSSARLIYLVVCVRVYLMYASQAQACKHAAAVITLHVTTKAQILQELKFQQNHLFTLKNYTMLQANKKANRNIKAFFPSVKSVAQL